GRSPRARGRARGRGAPEAPGRRTPATPTPPRPATAAPGPVCRARSVLEEGRRGRARLNARFAVARAGESGRAPPCDSVAELARLDDAVAAHGGLAGALVGEAPGDAVIARRARRGVAATVPVAGVALLGRILRPVAADRAAVRGRDAALPAVGRVRGAVAAGRSGGLEPLPPALGHEDELRDRMRGVPARITVRQEPDEAPVGGDLEAGGVRGARGRVPVAPHRRADAAVGGPTVLGLVTRLGAVAD